MLLVHLMFVEILSNITKIEFMNIYALIVSLLQKKIGFELCVLVGDTSMSYDLKILSIFNFKYLFWLETPRDIERHVNIFL